MKLFRRKDEVPERLSPRLRPGACLRTCGVPGPAPIYIPKPLLDEIVEYASGDPGRPRGGFLAGYPAQWKGERYVEVRAHLPAVPGAGDGPSGTITPSILAQVSSRMEALWPQADFAGWYYTRPGSGVFLTAQDTGLHRMYFNQWWMFVLVIDPTQGSLGFFQWNKDRLLPAGFTIAEGL